MQREKICVHLRPNLEETILDAAPDYRRSKGTS